MTASSEPSSRKFNIGRLELAAICVIVAAYVIWLLLLPAFPTEDGPIHLYYTHVLKALLSGHASVYTGFYRVKHLLPPYALYYYALLGLSYFVPLLMADKIIVCAYFVSFVFGFRYLARAVGVNADAMTLFASLLLLNWPLGMGFVNFCLSLSSAFWAVGLWLRFAGRAGGVQRILFVGLAVAAMFTHPVPLLMMLGAAGLEFLVRIIRHSKTWRTLPHLGADALTLFAAACTLGYVKLFTNSSPLHQTALDEQGRTGLALVANNAMTYAEEKGVAFLLGPGAGLRTYRVILLLALIVPLAIAVWQITKNRRGRHWTLAEAVLVVAAASLLLLPFIPHDLNGSHFFAERLLFVVWILPMFAASGGLKFSRATRLSGIGFVLVSQAITLFLANAKLRPVADLIAAADRGPGQVAAKRGELGLVLEDGRRASPPPGLGFNPLLWGAVDVVRHDDAVMVNAPWLDLAIIPLGAGPNLPVDGLKPSELEFPSILRNDLMTEPEVRHRLLSSVSFVLIQQAYRSPAQTVDPLLAAGNGRWDCQTPELGWVRVCRADR